MDAGVFFVVHVWRDVRGFHATARDVRHESVAEFDDLDALVRYLALCCATPPAPTTDDEA